MYPKEQNQDRAGPLLSSYVPKSVRNQVNGFTSFSYEDGRPSWQRHFEEMACMRGNGLRFTLFTASDQAFYDGLFDGIESDNMKEHFFLCCYYVMRKRGLWPVNIAVEQRLCDERWAPYTGCPNTPAAIQ